MLSALDLFAGAGGLSLGLKAASIKVEGAIETDRFASATYQLNFPQTFVAKRKIEECSSRWLKSKFSGIDLVAGGPPCQGFSVAGPSQYGEIDDRNALVLQMARVVLLTKPKYVLLENVKGILSGRLSEARRALDAYLGAIGEAGYTSTILRLQSADYGIPQIRERIFVVSARDAHQASNFARLVVSKTRRRVPASVCFDDLPCLGPGEGVDDPVPYSLPATNAYQKQLRRHSKGISNHVAMKHTPRMVARLTALRPGQSLKDVPSAYGQRQRNSVEIDVGQRFKMNCTRIDPSKQSLAIPSNFQTIHVHPSQHRMLTAREGARLQGFPDHFFFCGPRTLMSRKLLEREGREHEIGLSQYNQIGNAVPPPLARALGEVFVEL